MVINKAIANILSKTSAMRLLALASFFVMLALPVSAQETADSVFTLRFFLGDNRFFVPAMNNDVELSRLLDSVAHYKDKIKGHEIVVYVNGFCNSKDSDNANHAIAKIRSNRVKSELIVRRGLTEDCFITRNHEEQGDFVIVSFCPVDAIPPAMREVVAEEATILPEETRVVIPVAPNMDEDLDTIDVYFVYDDIVADTTVMAENHVESAQTDIGETAPADIDKPARADSDMTKKKLDIPIALKTNLLYYAALMPNIEVEWMFSDQWSVALEAQGAWYAKENPHKVYRLGTLMPEVRYWAISRSNWHGMYVGAFLGIGEYDLSNGKKGHEGEGYMGGLSAGYMWPIGKHLSLDASLGVGYMRLRDKEYAPLDGHYLYQSTKNINYFGPLRLKLSLVWRFQSAK